MLKYSIVAWFDELLHQANPDDHAPTPLVPADFAALEFLTNVHEIIFRIIETYEDPELDISTHVEMRLFYVCRALASPHNPYDFSGRTEGYLLAAKFSLLLIPFSSFSI